MQQPKTREGDTPTSQQPAPDGAEQATTGASALAPMETRTENERGTTST